MTEDLGFGTEAGQDIAVRDPEVHWEGEKALFSMVIGGTIQNDNDPVYFQIYEVSGIGQGETASIRKLVQPEDYNNIAPCYTSDDRIVFTSDRPRNGDKRLYPQLDEYESAPTVSGLWCMDADGSNLRIFDHSPSGDFEPIVDSFGRILFTRWDHLQRDQQADADIYNLIRGEGTSYEVVTYESEEGDASHALAPGDEVFPEQRGIYGEDGPDPVWDDMQETENGHTFNVFFPWMMKQDGTGMETLNHIGRLELSRYIGSARNYLPEAYAFETLRINNIMHIEEDPTDPGLYYFTNAPEFSTHSSGQIVAMRGAPDINPDDMRVAYITHEATSSYVGDDEARPAGHVGLFRDPLATSTGELWAVHTDTYRADRPTIEDPGYPEPYTASSRYQFAIRELVEGEGGVRVPGARLNLGGIVETISYFDNATYRQLNYSGPMWELQPVEVAPRPRPSMGTEPLPEIEQSVLEASLGGVEGIASLREYLVENNLALVVSRDVTIRGDEQQDVDLKIAGSDHQTAGEGATPKEIAWMQFFEGKQLRGYRFEGRRIIARALENNPNPPVPQAPEGSVRLGADGSMAALVPAGRALSWQMTEEDGTATVRERMWLTFQPGEIRACTNCHGLNNTDVFGGSLPQNEPQALKDLLGWWLEQQ